MGGRVITDAIYKAGSMERTPAPIGMAYEMRISTSCPVQPVLFAFQHQCDALMNPTMGVGLSKLRKILATRGTPRMTF
jgi:hypothetical protein